MLYLYEKKIHLSIRFINKTYEVILCTTIDIFLSFSQLNFQCLIYNCTRNEMLDTMLKFRYLQEKRIEPDILGGISMHGFSSG